MRLVLDFPLPRLPLPKQIFDSGYCEMKGWVLIARKKLLASMGSLIDTYYSEVRGGRKQSADTYTENFHRHLHRRPLLLRQSELLESSMLREVDHHVDCLGN